MRFLKKFNELNDPYDQYISNLEKICNESLAYLIDEGFTISIKDNKVNYQAIEINISKVGKESYFIWSEVKDDIIPLLELLSEKYEFEEVKPIHFNEFIYGTRGILDTYSYAYSYSDVINNTGDFIDDEVSFHDDTDTINCIQIYLKQPKPLD
jgi:hypothetical protein